MKIGLRYNLFRNFSTGGGDVFVDRLSKYFEENNLAKVKSGLIPNYEFGLFQVSKPKYFNFGKPFFLRLDGVYFDNKQTFELGIKINQEIENSVKHAKGVIFNSNFCKELYERILKKKIEKPHKTVYCAVPYKLFNPNGSNYKKKLGLENFTVLVSSANWRRHKRLNELIKFLEIINENKKKYKLLVLGKKPNNLKNFFHPDVFFSGKINPNALAPWYRTGDIYVHLSWIEPSGNTQIEALSCGLPVLCCNNGGIGETIEYFNGGIVSNCDEIYEFNYLDFYNPPEPDYKILRQDLEKIENNLEIYKKKIKFDLIEIKRAGDEYIEFFRENYKKN